jgi:hypothetical protein
MRATLTGLFIAAAIGFVMAIPQPMATEQLLGHYYGIQKSLALDSLAGVSTSALQMAELSRRTAVKDLHGKTQLTALANAAAKLQAPDLKTARNGFGELSDRLIAYLKATDVKRNPPYQFFCPMVKKSWLQPDKETRNPYYGSLMLKCGELVQSD